MIFESLSCTCSVKLHYDEYEWSLVNIGSGNGLEPSGKLLGEVQHEHLNFHTSCLRAHK